jgi:hypothetical protein
MYQTPDKNNLDDDITFEFKIKMIKIKRTKIKSEYQLRKSKRNSDEE